MKGLLSILAMVFALLVLVTACGGEKQTAPSFTPTGPAGEAADRQIAFIGADRGIWLVNADGSGRRRLAAEPCEDAGRVADLSLAWSPDGGKLAFICSAWADGQRTLVVLDDAGERLAAINDAAFFRWAPDGERLAYQTSDYILTTTPRYEVRMLDLASREDTTLAQDAWLVQWPLPARLLLGFNPHTPGFILQYDAHWLDLETGETLPVPRFDNSAQFWLTPDATKAVVLDGPADRDEGGATLAVYDLQTGEESPIPGSVIGYPSESIPDGAVAISPDSTKLYWADESGGLVVIYRANMDGSGLARLATVPSLLAYVTGEGLVAYPAEGVPGPIYVQHVETGTHAQVGEGFATMAWRPDSRSSLTPEEPSELVPPEGKAGPLRLRLSLGDRLVLLRWDDAGDEAGYTVEGSVKHGPPCELIEQGVRKSERLGFDEELPANSAQFPIPKPADERLSVTLELVLKVRATDIEGAPLVADSMAFTGDPICP